VRPLAHVPNSSPLQMMFKKSTLMSRSCDLFYGVPREHHPHVLGFDCDLNLGIGGPCDGFDGACWGCVIVALWAFRPCGPIGRLVIVSRFADVISIAAIKIMDESLCRPPRLSLSRLSCRNVLTLTLLLYYCVMSFDNFFYFTEVMARYNPLDEVVAGMVEVVEMEEKDCFPEDGARLPGTETVPKPDDDEVMVYEDFFVAGLRMPSHPALADILLHFQSQLHQLTPNAITQLSKYFWAVGSFGGVPSRSAFAKRYELHYQPKTMETPEQSRIMKDGCLNFHAKRDGSLKLSLVIKNK
jgi:hypothetical protein